MYISVNNRDYLTYFSIPNALQRYKKGYVNIVKAFILQNFDGTQKRNKDIVFSIS